MQKFLNSIIYILKYLFVGIFIMIITIIIQEAGLIYDDDLAFIFINLASTVVFMIMMKLEKKNVKEYLKFNILNSKSVMALIALAIGGFLIDLSLIPLLSNYLPNDNPVNGLTLTLAIQATLVVPICEEILFRGIVFNKLISSVNLILAVFIQALIFGLAHGALSGNVVQSVQAGLGSIVYSIVYLWTGTILAPILLHFLNNFFVTLAIFLGWDNITNQPHYIILLLGIALFIIAAKILFNITYRLLHEDKYMIQKKINVNDQKKKENVYNSLK